MSIRDMGLYTWPIQVVVDLANLVVGSIAIATFAFSAYIYISDRRMAADRDERAATIERERQQVILKANRESEAREYYITYLRLALQYPNLASAIYNKDDIPESNAYDSYVSFVLSTYDVLLNLDKDSYYYSFRNEVEIHKDYILDIFAFERPDGAIYRSSYSEVFLDCFDAALIDLGKSPTSPAAAGTRAPSSCEVIPEMGPGRSEI